jgi:hypothetical protein
MYGIRYSPCITIPHPLHIVTVPIPTFTLIHSVFLRFLQHLMAVEGKLSLNPLATGWLLLGFSIYFALFLRVKIA